MGKSEVNLSPIQEQLWQKTLDRWVRDAKDETAEIGRSAYDLKSKGSAYGFRRKASAYSYRKKPSEISENSIRANRSKYLESEVIPYDYKGIPLDIVVASSGYAKSGLKRAKAGFFSKAITSVAVCFVELMSTLLA